VGTGVDGGVHGGGLGIETVTRGDDVVVALAGDIDIHTAPEIRDRLAQLRSAGSTSVVVDLSGVNFLDSSALGALVAAHRDFTDAGGSLKIAAPRAHVLKVFRITRLSDVIPLFDTVDAACA
jgi:anti-sigma B factor antagonist